MTIYIVRASEGQYSDREEWLVAAYRSEADAKAHVMLADQEHRALLARSIATRVPSSRPGWERTNLETVAMTYDVEPFCAAFQPDRRYWVSPVKLRDKVPTTEPEE